MDGGEDLVEEIARYRDLSKLERNCAGMAGMLLGRTLRPGFLSHLMEWTPLAPKPIVFGNLASRRSSQNAISCD
jgi:hypothetical protein